MTNEQDELIEAVRTLDLEMRKLELESRLTRLKSEQSIDDVCVGGRVHARAAYIEGLKKELSICKQNEDDFKGKFVEQAQLNGVLLGQIDDLKTELVDKNKDSGVLMRVVEIVRPWDAEHAGIYPNLYQLNNLYDCLVDYLDAPEESDIDGHQDISITVALLERL